MEAYFRRLATERGVPYETVHEEIAARTALRHIPDSAEVAEAVVFFASDLARAITGQSLDVNGGHFFD
jgi:enoyl-[acyl-carrier-protein] reductase (NADH)